MRYRTITLTLIAVVILLLMTTSCSRYRAHHEPIIITSEKGPPAHAPAHGYRRKHVHGVELVFDTGLGVYVVVGRSDHYYHDGYFYRLSGGIWEMSLEPDSHWKVVSHSSLPIGLQVKAKAKSNDNGRGKSRGKAKGKHKKDAVSVGKLF